MRVLQGTLILLFLLFCFSGSTVNAQEEMTLDDCIELALQTRYSIIRAHGDEKLAKFEKLNALGAFLPRVSASYDYSKGKQTNRKQDVEVYTIEDSIIYARYADNILDQPDSAKSFQYLLSPPTIEEREYDDLDLGTSKTLSFSGSISIFDLSNWFNFASASANKASAQLNVIASEQDLIYSVKIYYYAYLASEENLSVQEEAVNRAAEQLKLTESKYELGSVSRSDVLKQKVQYGNDRLALLRAKNAVTNSMADLAYRIGLDPRKDYKFSREFTPREITGTLEEVVEFGLTHKPSLLADEKNVDAYKHNYRAAKAEYLPTLSAYGRYSIFSGTLGDTATYNYSRHSRTYGISASYNIFDGFFRERQVAQAKVYLNNMKALLADNRNLAVSQIKTAYLNIEQLKEQKKVSEENVEAAQEDLRITQEKYNLGAAAILELLDAQVSLKEAQVSLIQADFNLNLAIAELENAMGKM